MPGFRRLLICLSFLLPAAVLQAQPPIAFKHLSSKEGLSQSPVFTLLQDKQGLVWIGNREGLLRFDGYEFKKYVNRQFIRRNAIHNDIRAIWEDADRQLWLGTSSGVCLFNPQTEKFSPVNTDDAPIIYTLLAQGSHLWAGTTAGLRCFDIHTKALLPLHLTGASAARLFQKRVTALYRDRSGLVWAGTDQGPVCFDPVSGRCRPLPLALQNNAELAESKLFAIKQDKEGDMWFGTENMGLFWYRAGSQTCLHYTRGPGGLLSNFVRDVYPDGGGSVWIGTRNGLNVLDKTSGRFTTYTHDATQTGSLSNNIVWSFMPDEAGNLWLATYAGGINIYNPANTNFSNIGERVGSNAGLNEPLVNAVLPLKGGSELLVGTDGGGINLINRSQHTSNVISVKEPATGRLSDIVKALAADSTGKIWVGTLDGLASLDINRHSIKYFNFYNDVSSLIRINALLQVHGGVWVGSELNGLKFVRPDGTYDNYRQGGKGAISDNYITSFAMQGNHLWIGTRSGLNVYDPLQKKFKSYYPKTGNTAGAVILSLLTVSGNELWVGTADGLFVFNIELERFTRIGEHIGLNNQVIQSITRDSRGAVWVSTFNGLARIEPGRHQIAAYTATDGLISSQFSVGAAAHNGEELFFGGVNGLTTFYPNRLVNSSYQPKVVFTGLTVNNQPVQTGSGPVKLAYDQNYLSFGFSATSFLNPQNNRYAYKLEGLESHAGWHESGAQHTANYTNLEPGRYTFSVKSAIGNSSWSPHISHIQFVISPPWWRTWWAELIYVLLAVLVLYGVIRFFTARAKLKKDLFYEHLEHERHEALNQMKLEFFTNVSHELRTPLTLIMGPAEQLIRSTPVEDPRYPQLQFIKNNASRLLKLVTELLDFRKAETGHMKIYPSRQNLRNFLERIFISFNYMAEAAHITYEFVCPDAELCANFDDNQLEKVLYNLLVNAFKVTPEGGRIVLEVEQTPEDFMVSVRDSGKGIPLERQAQLFTSFYQVDELAGRVTGTGIGLALAKKIVDLHGGKLDVNSRTDGAPGQLNTSFRLTLPLNAAEDQQAGVELVMLAATTNEPMVKPVASTPIAHTVLVVEDNEELRTFLNYSLSTHYTVYESVNGAEGWQAATELIPDIIVSDVMMPEMDGLQLTALLKADERTSHIPVILLTARASETHQLSGLGKGADIYLTKPFNVQLLETHMVNLLSARAIWQKKFSQQVMLEPRHIPVDGPDQKFLAKLMDLIENNIDNEDFGVPVIASEVGMSQPVLYKKVKALTTMSVNDFVKSIRLKKAAQLIKQQEYTIYEVAYAVGFSDSKYFSKEFSKQFGMTPSAYKSAAKLEN
jgi:signal transduction histidine kinase/ligand-binding sensor domain-containing protein/AraC-like DNA-binding protein